MSSMERDLTVHIRRLLHQLDIKGFDVDEFSKKCEEITEKELRIVFDLGFKDGEAYLQIKHFNKSWLQRLGERV